MEAIVQKGLKKDIDYESNYALDNEKKEFMNSIDSVKKLWEAASSIDPSLSK